MFFKSKYLDLNTYLTERNNFWVTVFCKSMYCFLIVKIIFIWRAVDTIFDYFPYTPHSWWKYVLYGPLIISQHHVKIFLLCFLIILIIAVFIRINYVSVILICWYSISLSRLALSVSNGSDIILNIFLMIAILMPVWPSSKNLRVKSFQAHISAIAILLARIELALIYFISGYDKLLSEAWRSGAAVYSVMNLDIYYNPFLKIDLSEVVCIIICWIVIIFELAFTFFIWFRKARPFLLISGLIFHLGIILFLGLPDFGLVMIIPYATFLPIRDMPMVQSVNQGNNVK